MNFKHDHKLSGIIFFKGEDNLLLSGVAAPKRIGRGPFCSDTTILKGLGHEIRIRLSGMV
jgi:hypothetical protein